MPNPTDTFLSGSNIDFIEGLYARWLADRIPSAAVVVQAGAAHFGALDVLPDILRWLSADRPDASRSRDHGFRAGG